MRNHAFEPAARIAEEIFRERQRQANGEGHTIERDDVRYGRLGKEGELATAAAVYASTAGMSLSSHVAIPSCFRPKFWPWPLETFKPGAPRRMLIKAAALLVAQIELLDRRTVANADEAKGGAA